MRLHFSLSPNDAPVTFNYHRLLAGCLHKWMGDNHLHDALSLYSVGSLQGGRAENNALNFPRGASWHISAPDTEEGHEFLTKIAAVALGTKVCFGMEVFDMHSEATPEFGSRRVFRAQSPVFVGSVQGDDHQTHIIYSDPRADAMLTQTLHHKLEKAGLGALREGASVAFDRSYAHPKTKLIWVKQGSTKDGVSRDFQKRASVCPVIVTGNPEAVKFAWCVGAGGLTGMGFGSLI